MTMTLVATSTVGSGGASSIEFTSIPQDGTDLVLVLSARQDTSTSYNGQVNVNNDGTNANYSRRVLIGTGSTLSNLSSAFRPILPTTSSDETASTFGNSAIYFSNYAGSTTKSMSVDGVLENNGTFGRQLISANLWNNTAAITSVTVLADPGLFVQHTTASLYKITKGSDGIVTTS